MTGPSHSIVFSWWDLVRSLYLLYPQRFIQPPSSALPFANRSAGQSSERSHHLPMQKAKWNEKWNAEARQGNGERESHGVRNGMQLTSHIERLPPSMEFSRLSEREIGACCRRPWIPTHHNTTGVMPKHRPALPPLAHRCTRMNGAYPHPLPSILSQLRHPAMRP